MEGDWKTDDLLRVETTAHGLRGDCAGGHRTLNHWNVFGKETA